MADIRNSAEIDDFSWQGPGSSYSELYPADTGAAPWYTVSGSFPVEITTGNLGGTEFPPTSSLAFRLGPEWYGGSVETWAQAGGNPALTGGWRYGLYTVASCLAGAPNGYQAIPWNAIGGNSWILRRYDNGALTQLTSASYPVPNDGKWCLMRRVGGTIECWMSDTTDPNGTWGLAVSASDSTYVDGPWWPVYGTTGVENGWQSIGGGYENRQHIYRWLAG